MCVCLGTVEIGVFALIFGWICRKLNIRRKCRKNNVAI